MIRWLKRISPVPEAAFIGGIVAPLILLIFYGLWKLFPDNEPFIELQRMIVGFYCVVGGIGYGAVRVKLFHPHANEELRKWLATTPWRWPQPLPFGSVELVPQDAIAVLLATGWAIVATGSHWPLSLFVVLALIAYVLMLAEIASSTKVPGASFGIGITLAAALALAVTPWWSALFLVASTLIARWGNRQSLRRFHEWTDQLDSDDRNPTDWTWAGGNTEPKLGWPYGHMSPRRSGPQVSIRRATETSLLLGAWTWAVCHLINSGIAAIPLTSMDFSVLKLPSFELIPVTLGLVLAWLRVFRYVVAISPPLTWRGRIVHGRWLLAGYDRVFVVPLTLVGLGTLLSLCGFLPSIPLEALLPISVSGLTYLALAAGPTLEEWRLTSHGNIRRPHLRDTPRFVVTQ